MTDDLEALFDEISAQTRPEHAAPDVTHTPSPDAEPSEEELDALFDEVASASATPAAHTQDSSPTSNAEPPEEELEALFDEVASATAPNIASPSLPPPPTDTATDSASKPIYDRIGTILRQLHNSMRELGYDRALQDVVSEVTNAKGRLEYVATLAEQSATRVLNSIDDSMPQQEQLAETAKTIEQKWDALFKGELGIEDFKQLAKDSQQFAANAGKMAEQEKARLLEIMMAQDFQDITGQIIKKVVTITQRLEQDMAQILRDNAPHDSADKPVDLLAGPDVPVNALAQDDVDGLLGSLGF